MKIEISLKQKIINISNKVSEIPFSLKLTPAPLNYLKEKETFLASKSYNPLFIYSSYDTPAESIWFLFDDIESDINTLPDIYSAYFEDILKYLRDCYYLTKSIGKEDFYEKMKAAFDWKLDLDPDKLRKINLNPNPLDNNILDSAQIKFEFESILYDHYALTDWEIITDSRVGIRVRPLSRMVVIGTNTKRYKQEVKRLIVHELETHVLRQINSETQYLKHIANKKIKDYILYEEGFAVFNEYRSGTLYTDVFEKYIKRYELVLKLNSSFKELYDLLKDQGYSDSEAFDMVYRVKRGISDTSKPGGIYKDAAYALGFQKVMEYSLNNDVDFLFLGKLTPREKIFESVGLINSDNVIIPRSINKAL